MEVVTELVYFNMNKRGAIKYIESLKSEYNKASCWATLPLMFQFLSY